MTESSRSPEHGDTLLPPSPVLPSTHKNPTDPGAGHAHPRPIENGPSPAATLDPSSTSTELTSCDSAPPCSTNSSSSSFAGTSDSLQLVNCRPTHSTSPARVSRLSPGGSGLLDNNASCPGGEVSISRRADLSGPGRSKETAEIDEDAPWKRKRHQHEHRDELDEIRAEIYDCMLSSDGIIDDHNKLWILLEELGQGRMAKAVDALNSVIGLLLHHGNELPALRSMADRLRRVLDCVLEATLRSGSPITAPGVPGLSKKLKRSVQGNEIWSAAQNESCESGLYIDSLDRSAYTRHNRDGTARWIEKFRIEANDYVVYTDGSAKKSVYGRGDHGGASIALLKDGNWIGEFKALGPADSLTAELCGIDRGLGHGIENMEKKSIERLIIRTDCQAALSGLKKVLCYSKPRPSYLGIVDDIVQKLGILQSMNIMVALLWVKGHAICPGNYVADALAGHASDVSKKTTYPDLRWIKHSQCSWLDRVAMKAYNKSLSLAQDSNKRQRLNPGASESPSSLVPPVTPRFSWTPQLSAGSYSNPAAPSQLGASAGDPASGAVEFQVPSQPFTFKCPPSLPKGKSIDGGMFAFEGWLNKSKLQRTRNPAGVGKDVAEFESDD